ncbi:hypothetical protein FQA39_LY12542 [Lamprigera yunnana]|nr:hypothetical protein FQA39_LY12542 [Lamprigera yunnana]
MKKHVWTKISNEMRVHHHSYSWDQIQNEWKTLVRTYKSVKAHNSATGCNRNTWTFFEKIDYLMAKDPTVEPPTVVHNGHLQTTRVITEEAAPLDVTHQVQVEPLHQKWVHAFPKKENFQSYKKRLIK